MHTHESSPYTNFPRGRDTNKPIFPSPIMTSPLCPINKKTQHLYLKLDAVRTEFVTGLNQQQKEAWVLHEHIFRRKQRSRLCRPYPIETQKRRNRANIVSGEERCGCRVLYLQPSSTITRVLPCYDLGSHVRNARHLLAAVRCVVRDPALIIESKIPKIEA